MALLEFHVHEVDARATADFSLFGRSRAADGDEATRSGGPRRTVSASLDASKPEAKGGVAGLLLLGLALGVLAWLAKRRKSDL